MTLKIHRLICSYNIAGNNDIDASNDNEMNYSEQTPIETEVLRESESFQGICWMPKIYELLFTQDAVLTQ
jgi:hypothetical protein